MLAVLSLAALAFVQLLVLVVGWIPMYILAFIFIILFGWKYFVKAAETIVEEW